MKRNQVGTTLVFILSFRIRICSKRTWHW